MAHPICDFCSDPHVAWRYPAESFLAYVVAGIAGQSVGDWAACVHCHALIETGNRVELLERSVRALLANHPDLAAAEPEIRRQIAGFHRRFFANQTGAALPVA